LVCPEPIHEEVLRHVEEKSVAAKGAIRKSIKCHPILKLLLKNPESDLDTKSISQNLQTKAESGYKEFISKYGAVHVNCTEVSTQEIHNWYKNGKAPFGRERKKAEFPDAIAVAILDLHHASTG